MVARGLRSTGSFYDDIRCALGAHGYWVGSPPLRSLSSPDWDRLVAAAADLPPDVYAPGTGRYRTFDRFTARVTGVTVALTRDEDAGAYAQAASYNPELGGLQRRYARSAVLDASHAVLQEIVELIVPALAGLVGCARWTIHVHHIRYAAATGRPARNSPPGLHKDGERFISVHIIDRTNVAGGTNRIADNERQPLAEFTLAEPGDCFVLDDTCVWHAVDDIAVAATADHGHRDILLLDYLPDTDASPADATGGAPS